MVSVRLTHANGRTPEVHSPEVSTIGARALEFVMRFRTSQGL